MSGCFFLNTVKITLISQGVPPLGGVKQGCVGKTSYFRANVAATPSEYRGSGPQLAHRGLWSRGVGRGRTFK